MTTRNLSTVTTDIIAAYGITATHLIHTARLGGERMLGYVDSRAALAMKRGTFALNQRIRNDLGNDRNQARSIGVKALHLSTDGAQTVVGVAVDLAIKGVNLVAANSQHLDRAANLNALTLLSRVAMPAAVVVSQVAERIEAGSGKLVQRAAGNHMPSKAVATRKLNTATKKAAVARKKVVKTATRRVGKGVATAATATSNAARRVARKAKAVTAAA